VFFHPGCVFGNALLSSNAHSHSGASILIAEQSDYEALDQFFKMGISEEEYGYVLEGLKPISTRNFSPIEAISPYKDLHYAQRTFKNTVIVGKALDVWKKICLNQRNFVLTAIPLDQFTGWEVSFINIAKLKEVIEKNINLFRYILGPKITAETLTNQIADADEPLDSILQNDLVLTGIVLGYGIHNSLLGGRSETIANQTISQDCAPFLNKSQLMLSKKSHSLNVYRPEYFGLRYLAHAGGDDFRFQEEFRMLKPSSGFGSIEEEIIALDAMADENFPAQLKNKPGFVFGACKEDSSNQTFFKQLLAAQKRISSLLKRPDFLERVLEKIYGKAPVITCAGTCQEDHTIRADFTHQEWIDILGAAASRFECIEQKKVFFDSYCQPDREAPKPPVMVGASKEILVGLKKGLANLAAANMYFESLSKEASLCAIIPKCLYFKVEQKGKGKKIIGEQHVRMGYVIEDLEGHILFANSDTWLNLSQTIASFAHAVQGMQIGEHRALHIHPTYGYGALTTLPPCSGLIIKTHLLQIGETISDTLQPLEPISVEWIQNSSLLEDIEISLKQQPLYLGFLYRNMLEQVKGLDHLKIVAGLQSLRKNLADIPKQPEA
jgi:hypothetical protein